MEPSRYGHLKSVLSVVFYSTPYKVKRGLEAFGKSFASTFTFFPIHASSTKSMLAFSVIPDGKFLIQKSPSLT